MRKLIAFALLALAVPGTVSAQPRPPAGRQPAPVLTGIDALRADFAARTGGNLVYFGANSALLSAPARTALALQAAWLRRQVDVVVQVEGYGDTIDSRDHALALGARRAAQVRDYLVLLGVPSAQISITSWGNTKPGGGRAVTVLVR